MTMTIEEKLVKAMDLLGRVVDGDMTAPDRTWFREFYLLSGDHMILTEEGWESGEAKQEYLDSDPNSILDEVNES